jgi:hypothetical protein
MTITTNFWFQQATPATDLLGPLRGLAGSLPIGNAQLTWAGTGFNLIWRPNHGQSGPANHFLQLMFTTESLSFTEISGTGIANRGLLQNDILLGAASYLQQIADRFDNSSQHFEPGVWINVPATTNPAEAATVTRMGSIPHGATINLQGTATHITGGPHFPPVSIVPFRVGSPDDGETGLVHQPEETLATPSVSRTPLTRVAALDQAHLTNPICFYRTQLLTQRL